MLNVKAVFDRLELGNSSVTAVQTIGQKVRDANDPQLEAQKIIKQVLDVDKTYDNADQARLVAQAVGDEAWKLGCEIPDVPEFLARCELRIQAFIANPRNAFVFAKPDVKPTAPTELKQVAASVDVQVAVKTDGSIKKGGKETLTQALYRKHCLEATTSLTQQEFIALVIKEVGLSKPCATTYTYNCKTKLGEPVGGLPKSNKGRKAAPKTDAE